MPASPWGIAQSNAKPKFREPVAAPVVDFAKLRYERQVRLSNSERAAAEKLRAQRAIANEAVRKGRDAANRLHRAEIAPNADGPVVYLSYATVERRICKALGLSRKELLATRHHKDLVFARQAVMYWSTRMTKLSLPQIGKLMGRDHTTVLHGRDSYPVKRAAMGRHLRAVR